MQYSDDPAQFHFRINQFPHVQLVQPALAGSRPGQGSLSRQMSWRSSAVSCPSPADPTDGAALTIAAEPRAAEN